MKLKSLVFVIAFAIALGLCGWAWVHYIVHPKPIACSYSGRPLVANLAVTAEIDGQKKQVCCARCAISEANQKHAHLRFLEVHDYSTAKALKPEQAWFVEGSRAMVCNHGAMRMNEMKGTEAMAFDRCSPGTLAFANERDADDFVATNGGSVLSFDQLMREAQFQ